MCARPFKSPLLFTATTFRSAHPAAARGARLGRPPRGLTLVELLVATAISLLIIGAVVTLFARVGDSLHDARSSINMSERLQYARILLQNDLAGHQSGSGFIEIREGPQRADGRTTGAIDYSSLGPAVGDTDDELMMTTENTEVPFSSVIGRSTIGVEPGN